MATTVATASSNLLLVRVLDDVQRAQLASEWRRSTLTQDEFAAKLRSERGLDVSARALRLWCQRFTNTHGEGNELWEARHRVAEAAEVLRGALGHVEILLRDLDAQIGAATPQAGGAAPLELVPGGARHREGGDFPPSIGAAPATLPERQGSSLLEPEFVRPVAKPFSWDLTNQ